MSKFVGSGYISFSEGVITSQGADGYVTFYTGSNSIAGDNDFFYNRATGAVTIGGGGALSVDGYTTLNSGFGAIGDSGVAGKFSLRSAGYQVGLENPPHQEGLVFYDNNEKTLAVYNNEEDVTHQLGQEHLVRVKNESGVQIDDGSVVYITGASGNRPTVELAKADNIATSSSSVIGVATHNIANNSIGFITCNGVVNNIPIPIATFSDGDIVYLSATIAGVFSTTKPTGTNIVVKIGVVLLAHNTQGKLLVRIHPNSPLDDTDDVFVSSPTNNEILTYDEANEIWINVPTNFDGYVQRDEWLQNGFKDRTDAYVGFDPTTRTLTLEPTGASFDYLLKGITYTQTTTITETIADTDGIWIIYYDAEGSLASVLNPSEAQTDDVILNFAIVAYVFWNTTINDGRLLDELHSYRMSPETHHWAHNSIGSVYRSGMALNDFVIDDTGADNEDAQFSIAAGVFFDEDLENDVAAVSELVGSEVWYLDGADWRWTTNDGFSILTAGSGRMAFNDSGSQTEVTNNQFALCHIFATNIFNNDGITLKYIAIQGQAQYLTAKAAREGADTEINDLVFGTLPLPEIVPVATIIFQTKSAFSNDAQSRTVSTGAGDNYVDWRSSSLKASGGSIADHGALAGLADNDHPQYALTTTEDARWSESVTQRQDLRDAADGYGSVTSAEGADGYIAFFTGPDTIAGDNDLFYNRATGSLHINGNVGIGTTSPDFKLQVDGYIVPEVDNVYNLGTPDLRWQDAYLGPQSLKIICRNGDAGYSVNKSFKFGIDTVDGYLKLYENGVEAVDFNNVSGGGGGTPGGSDTQIQFNDSASFGGSSELTWDGSALTIGSSSDLVSPGAGANTFTAGVGATAASTDGVVIGDGASIDTTSNDSVCIGQNAVMSTNNWETVMIGANTSTTNYVYQSVVIGNEASIQGNTNLAVCIGDGAKIWNTGGGSVVIGGNAKAGSSVTGGSNYAICIGYLANTANSVDYSVAMGRSSKSSASYSLAIGGRSTTVGAGHTYAIVLGSYAVSTAAARCTIGTIAGSYDMEFEIAKGIIIRGGGVTATAGAIEWDGSNFRGHDGDDWVNLDTQGGAGGDTSVLEDQVTVVQNSLDGYALDSDLTTLDNRDESRWIESVTQRQNLRDAIDGYALDSDLTTLDNRDESRWIESVTQRQNLRDACDGYSGGGGGGTPGGSDTQIQFNDSASFGGSSELTWDGSALTIGSSSDLVSPGSGNNSFKAGSGVTTVGNNNVVIGDGASTDTGSNDNVCIGQNALVSTNNWENVFIGGDIVTSNFVYQCVGLGDKVSILGTTNAAIAIGYNAKIWNTGGSSIVIGTSAKAGSSAAGGSGYAICIGTLANTANNVDYSIVMGRSSKSSANYSIAIGGRSTTVGAGHTSSIALGSYAVTTAANRCTIGTISGASDVELEIGKGIGIWATTPPGSQPAAIADEAGTATGTDADMINSLKDKLNAALAALRGAGIIDT